MDIPCGSICRLRRFPITKIPASLDEVDELIAMVNDMLVAKVCSINCIQLIHFQLVTDLILFSYELKDV